MPDMRALATSKPASYIKLGLTYTSWPHGPEAYISARENKPQEETSRRRVPAPLVFIASSTLFGPPAPVASICLRSSFVPEGLRAAARCPAGWARKAAAGPLHLHAALVAVRSVACRRPPEVELAARG